mgnify:CR=1 FL=1
MMSKKAFLVAAGVFSASALLAQSVDEGKKMLYYERYESAKNIFAKEISANPQNGEAYYYLTQTFIADGKVGSADSLLKTVNSAAAADPLVKIATGHVQLLNGNKAEATRLFGEAVAGAKKKEQADLSVKVARAHVDAKDGDVDYALQLLADAEKKDKKNTDIYIVRGDAFRKQANGGGAMQSYQAALALDSKLARAKYLIGRIFLSQDNQEIYVQNFKEAVEIDPAFAPALYELYYYYYFRDANTAKDYLDKFIASSDPSAEHDYMIADLMFVSHQYDAAIDNAKKILAANPTSAEPRLFKLIAYSLDAKGDSVQAREYMDKYFANQAADQQIARDYEFMGTLLLKFPGEEMAAADNLEKAVAMDTVTETKLGYISKLSALYKKLEDRSREAYWLGEAYKLQKDPTNTELFNWGMAHYFAKEYQQADSVFGVYAEKYPDQVFGYFWRARANGAIDSTMEQGLAVPHYTKLIEVAEKDTAANKSLLIQSHGYLAAYHANVVKDYAKAVEHLDSVLVLAPENADAKANRDILQKVVERNASKQQKTTADSSDNKQTGSGSSGSGESGSSGK